MTAVLEKRRTKSTGEAEKMNSLLARTDEYVAFDLEMTGLSPQKGGRIIEIGAVRVRNGKIIDKYEQLIYPEQKIYKKTIELTGITNEMLEGKPVYGQALPEFYEFIGDSVLVSHNAVFDWDRFLLFFFEKVGIIPVNRVIDTLKLSKFYLPEQDSYKLGDLCKLYDISLDNAHRAIHDAIALAQLTQVFKNQYAKVEHGINNLFDYLPEEPIKKIPPRRNFKIRRISYWEKNVTKNKKMQRIYVNIGIGNVYFDIPTQTWYNKDVKGVPIDFKALEEQVLKVLNLNTRMDLCFYRNRMIR